MPIRWRDGPRTPRPVEPHPRAARARPRGLRPRERSTRSSTRRSICHLGFEHEGQPFVIPTLHARIGDRLYVHGSSASRTVRASRQGIPACVTVTLVDGIVLARSVFEHSMNYRSVVVLGTATAVVEPDEKYAALEAFTEKLLPGRWADARPPTRQGAEGDERAVAAARRGVGQGARRARRTTATRRTPSSTSGPGSHPARNEGACARCPTGICGRASRCRSTRGATGAPGLTG